MESQASLMEKNIILCESQKIRWFMDENGLLDKKTFIFILWVNE